MLYCNEELWYGTLHVRDDYSSPLFGVGVRPHGRTLLCLLVYHSSMPNDNSKYELTLWHQTKSVFGNSCFGLHTNQQISTVGVSRPGALAMEEGKANNAKTERKKTLVST